MSTFDPAWANEDPAAKTKQNHLYDVNQKFGRVCVCVCVCVCVLVCILENITSGERVFSRCFSLARCWYYSFFEKHCCDYNKADFSKKEKINHPGFPTIRKWLGKGRRFVESLLCTKLYLCYLIIIILTIFAGENSSLSWTSLQPISIMNCRR